VSAGAAVAGGNWRSPEDRPAGPTELKPAEARAASAALEYADQATAAKTAKLSLRTYQRTIARPHVRDAIAAGAVERLRRVTVAVARHAEAAVETLGAFARGEVTATSPRVRACLAIVEAAQRARTAEDQEQRLLQVERQIAHARLT